MQAFASDRVRIGACLYEQAGAGAIRKSLDDSIAKESEHVDSYNAGLSYIAGQ